MQDVKDDASFVWGYIDCSRLAHQPTFSFNRASRYVTSFSNAGMTSATASAFAAHAPSQRSRAAAAAGSTPVARRVARPAADGDLNMTSRYVSVLVVWVVVLLALYAVQQYFS